MNIIHNAQARLESHTEAVAHTLAAQARLDNDPVWQALLASIMAKRPNGCMFPVT